MTTRTDTAPGWPRLPIAAFERDRDDVLVIDRPPVAGVADAMPAARVHDWAAVVTAADADDRAAEALAALNLDCPALGADIAAVARSFLAQFGAAAAPLRVEVVDRTSCPRFHVDTVRVRLVLTHHGPATEYVCAAAPGELLRAPTGSLVFLKGHRHPGHADSVRHRSPAVPAGEKRLRVVLDI